MTRWACANDLNNYFRIKDLLGGLTDMQKKILRENIGINTSEGGQQVPTNITHAELTTLINNSSLITGARYIITDFQTVYESGKGEINPLLVTAINTNKIDSRVVSLNNSDWIIEYDPLTGDKGTITYLKDKNNNSAKYDFKSIKFSRTYNGQIKQFYTFSYIEDGEIKDASETNLAHDNELGDNCTNNVFVGETYFNSFKAKCYNNSFYGGCHDCQFDWETINNEFNESVVDLHGTIAGKTIPKGQNIFSSTVTKHIHNVNENTIMVHFDPDTFAQQITLIPDVYSQQIVTGTTWNS